MKSFKFKILACMAMTVLILSGCAGLTGPREVVLPLEKLQAALERKFPLDQRYLSMFDVRIGRPRLSLQPESNRVVTSLDAQILPSMLGPARNGSLILSGVLQLDSSRNAVMLTEPRVERLSLDGVDPRFTEILAQAGATAAEKLLRNVPLYTFDPADLRYAGVRFEPVRISTRSDALVVTFVPAK